MLEMVDGSGMPMELMSMELVSLKPRSRLTDVLGAGGWRLEAGGSRRLR